MKQILLVFLGGGAGSALRFLISRYMNPLSGFPFGTFAVNIIGSLLIGLLVGLSLKQNFLSQHTSLVLITGFCGGFTTFSAFAYENQILLRTGDFGGFALYTLASLIFGIAAVFLGIYIIRIL